MSSTEKLLGVCREQKHMSSGSALPDQLVKFYECFSRDSLVRLADIYDDEIHFKDPVHELKGIVPLTRYFEGMCSQAAMPRFKVNRKVESGYEAFIAWEMRYSHAKLAGGQDLKLEGASYIKFAGKVLFQEDFYDLGSMLYEHIPGLGFVIKRVKSRLKNGS